MDKYAKKDWTVMVYMSGDNNLSEEMVWSLKEMYRVGIKDEIGVVARYDSRVGGIYDFDIGALERPQPVRISNEGDEYEKGRQSSQKGHCFRNEDKDGRLKDRGASTGDDDLMASATALKDFVIKSARKHKAENYMLVLSGHAGGTSEEFLMRDETPERYISLPRLGWAIEQVKARLSSWEAGDMLDIIGFDACSMSMAEVGYELRNVARYMVAAEGFEMNTGWPYHRIIEDLIANSSELNAEQFASNIVKRYIDYYSDYSFAGVSADMSACNLGEGRALARAVKKLAHALEDGLQDAETKDRIIIAHWHAQSFMQEEFTDLWDFCNLLRPHFDNTRIGEACDEVMDVIKNRYVLKSCYCGGAYQHSHGLSIYFPWVEDKEALRKYQRLDFAKDTEWGNFLQCYVTLTRREARLGAGPVEKFDPGLTPSVVVRWMVDDKGPVVKGARMKNWCDEFYKDECE